MEKAAKMSPLRDVRNLDGYVHDALKEIGVRPSSGVHAALMKQGLDSAYRLERALPPETSLRAVLDAVLRERLISSLRRADTLSLPGQAVAGLGRVGA